MSWSQADFSSVNGSPKTQRVTRQMMKRRAKESPTIVSSEDEKTENGKETRKKKSAVKRQKSRRIIISDDSGSDTLVRTTSLDTLNDNSDRNNPNRRDVAGTSTAANKNTAKDTSLPSSNVAGQAFDWLKELDSLRVKSGNLKGDINGQMKRYIRLVREAVATLTDRVDANGDTAFLKMRNAELTVELNVAKQESSRLKAELTYSQKMINDLKTVRRVSMGYSPKRTERKYQGGMKVAVKSPDNRKKNPSYIVDTDEDSDVGANMSLTSRRKRNEKRQRRIREINPDPDPNPTKIPLGAKEGRG